MRGVLCVCMVVVLFEVCLFCFVFFWGGGGFVGRG